jgi:oligopeptide transport system substrate-binding protein
MKRRILATRRQLIGAGGIAFAFSSFRPMFPTVRAQASSNAWKAADGLRLAGPSVGLSVLDPALARDFREMSVLRQIFRGILGFDMDLAAVPVLAKTMDVSADARQYTFALRQDARFHDGRAVLARDIHASFVRALSPSIAGGDVSSLVASSFLGGILGAREITTGAASSLTGFEIIGERSFTISLAEPDAAFPFKLASVPASIVDATQTQGCEFPNGTGPYAVSGFVAGESLDLRASESWFGETPAVLDISFRLGIASSLPLNLFQGGEIDLIDGVPFDQMRLLEDPASGMIMAKSIATPLFSVFYLALSTTEAPLDDINIRRALQHAFPVARFAGANAGNVTAAEGFIPPGMLGEQWEADLPAYDLEAARRLIGMSAYGPAANVPPIAIYGGETSLGDPLHNVGLALKETAGVDLGITIEPISVDWNDFITGLPRQRFSSYSITWIADYPDPESLLAVLFESGSGENYTGYRNDAFDALLVQARSEPAERDRIALYRQAQQMLIDDAVLLPLFFDISYTAMRPEIAGVPVTAIGMLGLESVYEKVSS